jgi:hypothetical protein
MIHVNVVRRYWLTTVKAGIALVAL